jgi:hypothetical protein
MDKDLMLQSLKVAYTFLEGAEKILDLKKGEGYAVAHPDLVAAFTLTAALDYHASHANVMLGDLATSLGRLSGE